MKKTTTLCLRSSFRVLFFCLLATAFAPALALGQVRLARLFSDGAVLQRQKPVPVWGWARPGESVTVTFNGQTKTATAAASDGRWSVVFAPMEAGGPYELKVSSPSGTATAKDVLLGEVWLCSGQSNMEWKVRQADNFAGEQNDADYPKIRHFYVDHVVEIKPVDDLAKGEWKSASKETVGDFTAIGFFFARELYKKLGVPVGLVHSSWGGSQVEGWISKEAMLGSDELRAYGEKLPSDWAGADALLERKIKESTLGNANANPSAGDERRYTEAGYDFSKWIGASPFGAWDWKGVWAWRGNGYTAVRFDVPASFENTETTLGLARLYSWTEVYINGRQVFQGILKGPREIVVPRGVWKAGANSLVMKMNRAIDPEWYGLGLEGAPKDLFVANGGGERVELGGLQWKMMPAFSEPHSYSHSSNNLGTTIYNGMIAPIVGYGIRGVLWYQGETNAGRSYQYRKTFPLMIRDWRGRWNDEFDFLFVQLSSWGGFQDSNAGSGWAELREAQTMTLALPKTGMAVTTDIGNPTDIHPTNKQDVGRRLAAWAFKHTYGIDVPFSGPMYESVKFEDGRAVVSFKYGFGGLVAKDKNGYLRGFEIAGADKKFRYAKAEIKGDTVVVWNDDVKAPASVRYAWTDSPIDANLFNGAGFPAVPFRTDEWPGVTVNEKFR